MTFGFSTQVLSQCDEVAENSFDNLCISQSGDGSATAVMSNILDVYDLGSGAPGTDGTGDVQITMEAMVCNAGCGEGSAYDIGACIGSGGGALGTTSDFATDFNSPPGNETTCEGAGGYVIVTIDFLNGFSTTAAGFDIPQGSNNGASEGYEGTFGWVTMATDATGTPLTGLPSVNMANFCNYTSTDYATTQMSTFVGATGAGSWQTDSQNTMPNQIGPEASDANGQNICGVTLQDNGEDTASGTGPDQGVSAATANPNLGLNPTDIITQVKYVYFYSSTPSIDCDDDGLTAANSDPAQSWTGFDFCGPPPPPAECGSCTGDNGLFITEVYYNHPGSDGDCEYIEIFNAFNNTIDLEDWELSNGIDFTFPAGSSIASGEYIILTLDGSPSASCGFNIPVGTQVFDFGGTLTNTSETILLSNTCIPTGDEYSYSITYDNDNGGNGDGNAYYIPIDGSAHVGAPTTIGSGNCGGCDVAYECIASCPDLTGLTDGMLDIGVTESTCIEFEGTPSGGELTAPTTACPEESSLRYSIDGGVTWTETLPTYDQTTAITIDTRCECDQDATVVSPTSSVTTVPGECPECPDLSGIAENDLQVNITESTCIVFGGNNSGGEISAPTMSCPDGSTLEYSVDGGAWTTTLPSYNQNTSIEINTRCICDADPDVISEESSITTDPGECPACPDLSLITSEDLDIIVTESTCDEPAGPPTGGVIEAPMMTCPTGSTLEYSVDDGAWTTTLPIYDQATAIKVETRCACDEDDTVLSAESSVTTVPGVCPDCPTTDAGPDNAMDICMNATEILVDLDALLVTTDAGVFTETSGTPSGVSLATTTAVDFAGVAAGTYTFAFTTTVPETCTADEAIITIVVEALPAVVFHTTENSCDNSCANTISLDLTDLILPGSYAWTGPGGFTSDMQMIGGVDDCLVEGTYTLEFTDANGCVNTGSIDYDPMVCDFDLALTKVYTTTGVVTPSDVITFDITVINQGDVEAYDVDVLDYYPAGCLIYGSAVYASDTGGGPPPSVTDNGTGAFTISNIAMGTEVVVTLTFTIDASCTETEVTNNAEIVGGSLTEGGDDAIDSDSTPGDNSTSPPDTEDDDTANEMGGDDFDPATFIICQSGCDFPWDGNE